VAHKTDQRLTTKVISFSLFPPFFFFSLIINIIFLSLSLFSSVFVPPFGEQQNERRNEAKKQQQPAQFSSVGGQ